VNCEFLTSEDFPLRTARTNNNYGFALATSSSLASSSTAAPHSLLDGDHDDDDDHDDADANADHEGAIDQYVLQPELLDVMSQEPVDNFMSTGTTVEF
jgi:hypothetical protein